MNVPTIRNILDYVQAPMAFIDALNLMGANLSAPLPMRGIEPPKDKYVAGLIRAAKYVNTGQRILAIKEIRELFGTCLKDSKDIIDAFVPPKPWPNQ